MLRQKIGFCGYPLLEWLLKRRNLDVLYSLRCSSTNTKPRSALPGGAGADAWLCTNTVSPTAMGEGAKLQQCLWLQGSSWDSYYQLMSVQG